jgi:hypothetical protein
MLAICLAWLYRQQISNGFTLLSGLPFDAIISTTITEHWYQVFLGKANWAEVNYFFPHTRVIAQSDAYFLNGVLYTPFRLLGYDPFLAAEFANMAMKAIGFVGAYFMCRKVFSLQFHWALLAAVLFTINSGIATHSSRSQLLSVALTPVMVLLIWDGLNSLSQNKIARFRIDGVVASALFGAWCLTCFYMAWFFLFFFTVFVAVAAVLGGRNGLAQVKQIVAKHYVSILLVLGSAVFFLLPFLYAYIPKSHETGVRPYWAALFYTVPPINILQVGTENLWWGQLYNKFVQQVQPGYFPSSEYYNTGLAIGLFGLFLCSLIQFFNKAKRQHLALAAILLATLLTWIAVLNIQGHSAWFYVYKFFPGAKALRVVGAYQLFLALPVILIAVKFLSTRRLNAPVIALVCALLVAEELSVEGLSLSRQAELDRIALPHAPPKECQSFYTSGWSDQGSLPLAMQIYAHNVTAMLIAQNTTIPTLNGFASFMAPDWDFDKPNTPSYDARVASYAGKHGLSGLCKLDLNDKSWRVIDDASLVVRAMDVNYFEKSAWPGGVAEAHGLSGQEEWGAWSEGELVTLQFTVPLPEKFDLHLTGHAFSRNAGKEFVIRLEDPQNKTAGLPGSSRKFILPETSEERVFRFDNPAKAKAISIVVPYPVSPFELKASGDERRLGIGLEKIRIEPL